MTQGKLYRASMLCLMILFMAFCNASGQEKRYNILWISCEDIGPALSSYGDNSVRTPNIDKLASEGILYENAYATTGVCAPSRFAIITGTFPVRMGAHNMRTGNHWGYRTPEQETYLPFKEVTDRTGRNVPEYSVVLPANVKCFTEYLRAAGYYTTNNPKCDYQFSAPITAWDEVGNMASYKNTPGNKPFFSVINLGITHESQIWKKEDDQLLVDTSLISIPGYYPDIPVVRKDLGRKYSNIAELDRQVGEIVDELERQGVLKNTIIFFWSDHGGPLLRQKRAVGNSGLHVPLIVRFPDGEGAGTRIEDIVSLMDLGPTVLSLTGIEPPEYMDGKAFLGKYKDSDPWDYAYGNADRFDEYTGMSRSVIDGRYVYIRNFMPHLPYSYRLKYREQIDMVPVLFEMASAGTLTDGAAYIFSNYTPPEELYDLHTDPDEIVNLAGNPDYADKLNELRTALGEWQLSMGDKGFIAEHDLIQMMWPGLVQPETGDVVYEQKDGLLELKSATEGASIAYQVDTGIGGKYWNLYWEPIPSKAGMKVVARAVRIGYKASAITTCTVE